MNNDTNEWKESAQPATCLTVKITKMVKVCVAWNVWWDFYSRSLQQAWTVLHRPVLHASWPAVCIYSCMNREARLLLGALSSVLCLHLQTKNISYTLVKKKKKKPIEVNAHQVRRYESRHAPVARQKLPQSFSWSPHKTCVLLWKKSTWNHRK